MYEYLMDLSRRESVKDRAKELNGGDQHNSCVYFASEALRRVGLELPLKVCNTGKLSEDEISDIALTSQLLAKGWKTGRDPAGLLPGDLCFTTPDSSGRPTHVYIFMSWEKEGSYEYANVCDNQSYDYGTTYHLRNVQSALPGKEAFSYYMYLE
jgi:hypothetical protein